MNIVLLLAITHFVLLVFAIGLLDYLLFYKSSTCPHCKKNVASLYSWIPATFLELGLFIAGVVFGFMIHPT